jgi:hypothetical protein
MITPATHHMITHLRTKSSQSCNSVVFYFPETEYTEDRTRQTEEDASGLLLTPPFSFRSRVYSSNTGAIPSRLSIVSSYQESCG